MSTDDTEKLLMLVLSVGRQIREHVHANHALRPFSIEQLEALRYIHEHGTPVMKEVARHLHVTPPAATGLIEGLVNAKAVERIPEPKDRRVIRLRVTKKGATFLQNALARRIEHMRQLLQKLTPEDQKHLTNILKKLSDLY